LTPGWAGLRIQDGLAEHDLSRGIHGLREFRQREDAAGGPHNAVFRCVRIDAGEIAGLVHASRRDAINILGAAFPPVEHGLFSLVPPRPAYRLVPNLRRRFRRFAPLTML